jgi:hypothetical protein
MYSGELMMMDKEDARNIVLWNPDSGWIRSSKPA